MAHVLIGAVVDVRDGAIPVGLDEFDEDVPKYRTVEDVCVHSNTVYVAGWYWSPNDLVLR